MNTSNSNSQEPKVQSSSEKPVSTNTPSSQNINKQVSNQIQSSMQNQNKSFEEIIADKEKQFKEKQAEIKQKYKEKAIFLDKIKFKNDVYVESDNKGKQVKISQQRAFLFIQGRLQLEKEKSARGDKIIKQYKTQLQKFMNQNLSLKEQLRIEKQKNEISIKRNQAAYDELQKEFDELSKNYNALSGQKEKQLQGGQNNGGASIVPFIMQRIDNIVKQKNKYIKLSQQDLVEFKLIKHDPTGIINKMVFLLQKLKEKEQEKDQLQKEQKVETEFHNDQKERLRELVADYSKKYRKSQQLVEICKVQNRRCLRIMTQKQEKLDKLIRDRNSLKRKYEQYQKIEKVQGKKAALNQAQRRRKAHTRMQMKHKLMLPRQMEDKLNRICEQQFKIDQMNGVPMRKPTQKQLMLIQSLMQMGAFNNMDQNGNLPEPTEQQKNRMFQYEKARLKKQGIRLLKDPVTGKTKRAPLKNFKKNKAKVMESESIIKQGRGQNQYFGQDNSPQRQSHIRVNTSTNK